MNRLVLISVKERYVQEILSGKKTIELRKSRPRIMPGDTIIIYTTNPVKAITAIAAAGNVFSCSPARMWKDHSSKLGISKKDFFEYYGDLNTAIGIELVDVKKLDAEILLSAIKIIDPKFTPPQTFKYISKVESPRIYQTISNSMH